MTALRALIFSLCFFLATPAMAAGADAGKFIESLGEQTLTLVSNPTLNKEQKRVKLEKIFSTNVDIDWVGRFVMGRFWRQATDQQKEEYLKRYDKFLVTHYASRFTDYTSGSFKVTGTKDDGEGEHTVSMEIQSPELGNDAIFIEYRVRKNGGSFKIFDVIVEGVSLITTQRAEFGAVISRHSIDYLIENLSVISTQSLPGKGA